MKKLVALAFVSIITVAAFSQKRVARVKTKEEVLNEQYCNGLFKTYEGTYFDLVNDNATVSAQGYRNILEWLEGRVAGLQVYRARNNERIPFIRNSRAGIYVDEMQVSADFLNLLSTSDIAMIKIIKGPFAGASNSPGGVIAIYTIQAEEGEEEE